MIVTDAPQIAPAEAARRAARGRLPVWLCSPGAGDLGVEREFVACDPAAVARGDDPAALEAAWAEARGRWSTAEAGVPVAVGSLAYDLGRRFERLRGAPPPPADPWPDIDFRLYDAVWAFDARAGRAAILAAGEGAAAALRARLARPLDAAASPPSLRSGGREGAADGALASREPPALHLAAVRRILEYIRAGDVYQVNLARRLAARVAPAAGDGAGGDGGLSLFARLQAHAPAPHALWLADDERGRALVGNTPERFLRLDPGGALETCPIKGTRPRAADPDEDARAASALRDSAKDRAEHTMIVDLERNDLGRICATGSVEVSGLMRVLTLPTVHHLVSTVRGRLRPGVGLGSLLRATFPGGSVTGAPKIRAMEIIDELEPARRGPYTGATGWLGAAGDLDLAVAIRTALIGAGSLTLWVGGGIVAESDPEAELAETEAKAAAFAGVLGR